MTSRLMIFVAAWYPYQTNLEPLESTMVVKVKCNSYLSFWREIEDIAVVTPGLKNNAEFTQFS